MESIDDSKRTKQRRESTVLPERANHPSFAGLVARSARKSLIIYFECCTHMATQRDAIIRIERECIV